MIRIDENVIEGISKAVRAGYPKEVCGVLIGKRDIEIKTVEEFHAVSNVNGDRSEDRYELDPKEFKRLEEDAKSRSLEVVGIYHSHPDHPAEPSETDRSQAWPVYSYVIFSVIKGKGVTCKSFVLDDGKKKFEEEELDILSEEMGEA